jgi:hypothetical protein
MRNYFVSHDTPVWEIAFGHTIYAHADWAAGIEEAYGGTYQDAVSAIDMIADPEDREVVMRALSKYRRHECRAA